MASKPSYHLFALLTILCWSLSFVFTRLGLHYFSSQSLGVLRLLAASAVLALLVLARRMPLPALRDLPLFFASGACGFGLYLLVFNRGCETVTAATASMVLAVVPVLTAVEARLFCGEKLLPHQWAATGVELAGILLLTMMDGAFSANSGVLWLLAGSAMFGGYNLLQRRLTRTYPVLQCTAYSIFFGTLILLFRLPAAWHEAAAAPAAGLAIVVLMGVVCSAVAYCLWAKALLLAPRAADAANYNFLTPVFTSILGFWLAGEVPAASALCGGAVILAGLFWFNHGHSSAAAGAAPALQPVHQRLAQQNAPQAQCAHQHK